jgi:thymidylate kinase
MSLNNILIFEGPDGSGKTNIATELATRLNYQYFKNQREHKLFSEEKFYSELYHCEMAMTFLSSVKFAGGGIVMDRFTPSEWAYSYAYNRKTNPEYILSLDKRLADLGACIIYLYKENVPDNFDDEFVTKEDITEIIDGYSDYFEKTSMQVIKLATDSEDLEAQVITLISELNKRNLI